MSMLVICPSRGRPGNIAELIEAWRATSWDTSTLLVCVDDDDPQLDAYRVAVDGAHLVTGPRRSLCGWLNLIALLLPIMDFNVVGFFGDDVRPRTPGWDVEMAKSVGRHGVAYGNDLHQGGKLATHPFIDVELVKRFGFFGPPGVEHLYVDNVWHEVGRRLGTLVYRDDVVLEHMHPHAGKADMDDVYRQVNSREQYVSDQHAFTAYMAGRFHEDIKGVLGG